MLGSTSVVYFDNLAGRISSEPGGYWRLGYHAGQRTEADFRMLLTQLLRALVQQGRGRVLINQQLMPPFSAAEQAWMVGEWLPRAVLEGGYRYGAIVLAKDVFARLAMNSVDTSTRHLPHTYRNFADEQAAQAWLLAQN